MELHLSIRTGPDRAGPSRTEDRRRDTLGGYSSSSRLVTDLRPPPPGPAPGSA